MLIYFLIKNHKMVRSISVFLSSHLPHITQFSHYGTAALLGIMAINPKYLQEYRCPVDQKLLAKGFLKDSGSVLEAKCRGCGKVSTFTGEDKEILVVRKKLLKEGKIPDTE